MMVCPSVAGLQAVQNIEPLTVQLEHVPSLGGPPLDITCPARNCRNFCRQESECPVWQIKMA